MRVKKYYKLVRVDYEDSAYMRLKNISNETGIFKVVKSTPYAANPDLDYSLDGVNWTTYDFATLPEVIVAAGANIYFRGTNAEGFNSDSNTDRYITFDFNKTYTIGGNIISLIDKVNYATKTNLVYPFVYYSFYKLFLNQINLISAAELNFGVFGGAPGNLNKGLCESMFQGCTSLTTPPDMSSFTKAGTIAFRNMFRECTSLTIGADLSNVTDGLNIGSPNEACSNLYNGCSSLSQAITPNISDINITNWLANAGTSATGTKVVRVPTGATIATDSVNGIPTGWTRVDY